jgi:hypothetical protein
MDGADGEDGGLVVVVVEEPSCALPTTPKSNPCGAFSIGERCHTAVMVGDVITQ